MEESKEESSFVLKSILLLVICMICVLPLGVINDDDDNWKSAQVVTSHPVCDPTVWQPGFDLPWQQWSLLYWTVFARNRDIAVPAEGNGDLASVSLQRDSDVVPHCRLTKLYGGLFRLHSADEDFSWLTNYGSWHAYEKKNINITSWVFDNDVGLQIK